MSFTFKAEAQSPEVDIFKILESYLGPMKKLPQVHVCTNLKDGNSVPCVTWNKEQLVYWHYDSNSFKLKKRSSVSISNYNDNYQDLVLSSHSENLETDLIEILAGLRNELIRVQHDPSKKVGAIAKIRAIGAWIHVNFDKKEMVSICEKVPGHMDLMAAMKDHKQYQLSIEYLWDGIGTWQG